MKTPASHSARQSSPAFQSSPTRTGTIGVTNADGSQELIITPIVPVRVGEDWKAGLLWRALWDAGVFTNVAGHPAVPPDGALLRTSVMATHDDEVLDRALEIFAKVKREFEAVHGPLPGPSH